jgi:replicative DNA helicase
MTERDKNELYILKGLLKHVDFVAKFCDKLKHDYFSADVAPTVLTIKKYFLKTQKLPTIDMICEIYLMKVVNGDTLLKEKAVEAIEEALGIPFEKKEYEEHYDWLCSMTKEWIINKSIENALVSASDLYQKGKPQEAVQKILEASHVNFDEDIGLEYIADLDKRIENLKEKQFIMPTGNKSLDDRIGGGWRPKSLIIFGAATNVGKTLILGAISAQLMQDGYNGLYITLEINDYMLANRIDANLADIALSDIPANADRLKEIITNKVEDAKRRGKEVGRLIIKEYPPASISSQNILSIIRELETKRMGFKPDFICVDYVGLMIPNNKSFSDNTYGKLKTVSEELRAIGSKLGVPIFSAVQVNRAGYNEEKLGMNNTSDSMGIPMTADLMIMVSRNEELDKQNKMWWEIAKSRWSKNGGGLKVHVDFDHMRISDGEDPLINEELTDAQRELLRISRSEPTVNKQVPFKKTEASINI